MKIHWLIFSLLLGSVSACSDEFSSEEESPTGLGGWRAKGGSAGASPEAGQGGNTQGGNTQGGNTQGGEGGSPDPFIPGGNGGANPFDSPCGNVPEGGICLDAHTLQRCLSFSGQGKPQIITQTCPVPKVCAQVGGGDASCFLDPSLCEPGSSKCLSSDKRADCDSTGHYVTSSCPSCKESALGPSCKTTNTIKISGALDYEYKIPNLQYTDWSPTKYTAPASGLFAVSIHSTGEDFEFIDATILDENGKYSLNITSPQDPNDLIVFLAVRPSNDGKNISFAVGIPATGDGSQEISTFLESEDKSEIWSWSASVSDVLGSLGGKLTIKEENGSPAIFLFNYLAYVYQSTEYLIGSPGDSLVVWLRPNTSWDCGACRVGYPSSAIKGSTFDSQIFISATAVDQGYWSGAVNAHELGHWVMGSYGYPAVEGGFHMLSCSTFPGQAWSEGWATAFSSLARAHSIYYDKQEGSFFWFDIATGASTVSNSPIWPKPSLADGLYQFMSENEVAAILWNLATKPASAQEYLSTNLPLLNALRSTRMTQPPFARGYQQSTWDASQTDCSKENIKSYSNSIPMLADYLDALVCNGFPKTTISNALKTGQGAGQGYPYDPNFPFCQ